MLIKGYMNLYKSGFYHRQGKPDDINVHGGDVYLTQAAAEKHAEPEKGFLVTIPIYFPMETQPVANASDSQPIGLSSTRKQFAFDNRDAVRARQRADEALQPTDTGGVYTPTLADLEARVAAGLIGGGQSIETNAESMMDSYWEQYSREQAIKTQLDALPAELKYPKATTGRLSPAEKVRYFWWQQATSNRARTNNGNTETALTPGTL